MRIFFTPVLAMALAWISLLSPHHALGAGAIVPGQSIADVHLMDTVASLEKRLGAAPMGDAAMGRFYYRWPRGPHDRDFIDVYAHRNEQGDRVFVKQIRVASPAYRTAAGISVKSDLRAIWQAYPGLKFVKLQTEGKQMPTELYDDPALGFAIEVVHSPSLHCSAIIVHRPGVEVTSMSDNYSN